MDIKNITVGKPKTTGAVYVAPLGTTLPTDASTALATDYIELGHVSEDGITNENSPETEDIKAWGGTVVYSSQTEKTDTFTFALLETLKTDVLKVVYGDDNVTVADGNISINATTTELPERVYVIDMLLRNGSLKRIVIPDGKISEIGEITYKDDELASYELTITCLPTSGCTHKEYITVNG